MLQTGNNEGEIKIAIFTIFAIIGTHYSVNKKKWLKYNGDAFKIGEEAQLHGQYSQKIRREPEGLWERFISFIFQEEYYEWTMEYCKLGVDGLTELLPRIYLMLYELEEGSRAKAESETRVRKKVQLMKKNLEPLTNHKKKRELATQIGNLLMSLFNSGTFN